MTDEPLVPAAEAPEAALDIESAVADIADSLSLTPAEEEPLQDGDEPAPAAAKEDAALAVEAKKEEPIVASTDPAPDTWRKEAKEAWAAVPPVVKEEMRKREADISRYVEQVKVPVSVGEQFTKILEPYLPMFQANNINPWDNVTHMLKAQELLLFGSPETKLAMVQSLAQQAGVKLEGGQLSSTENSQARYIQQLEQRLGQLEGGVKNITSTVHEARTAELEGSIMAFAQDTEKHPYFFDVADKITHFIKTGAATNLDDAYQLAVMADPVTKAKAIDAEATRVATQKADAEKERVDKARKASKVNVRSTARGRAVQPSGDIDSTLKDTLAEIHARH